MAPTVEITDEIAEILGRSLLDGWSLHLPPNVGSMLKAVDKVLRAAGACWNRSQQAAPSGLKGAYVVHQDTMQNLQMQVVEGRIVIARPVRKPLPTPLSNLVFDGSGIYHYGQ